MPFLRLRRAVLTAALASSALLVACGGGEDIVDRFTPSRGVLMDAGASSWSLVVLAGYGAVPLLAANGGVEASLASVPVAAGRGTASLAQRIDALLASGGVSASDLVIVSAGVPDILAETQGAQSTDAMAALGQAMADQVRRLVDAGATHVLVANAYDVGKTPLFRNTPQEAVATRLTRTFNDRLKLAMVDLGDNVLLVDAEEYVNRVVITGGASYSLNNVSNPACAGSTVGLGSVSASSCTSGAFGTNNPAFHLFYDPVYLTPAGQKLFGDYALALLRERW